jgi:hypothetical protein
MISLRLETIFDINTTFSIFPIKYNGALLVLVRESGKAD